VSLRRLREPKGNLTAEQKSAEGVVGHVVGDAIEALGAADKAANLERWKSFFCQLPVFGQIAYPVRAEATKHD
jgi:phosphoribosylamine-glycine ligase